MKEAQRTMYLQQLHSVSLRSRYHPAIANLHVTLEIGTDRREERLLLCSAEMQMSSNKIIIKRAINSVSWSNQLTLTHALFGRQRRPHLRRRRTKPGMYKTSTQIHVIEIQFRSEVIFWFIPVIPFNKIIHKLKNRMAEIDQMVTELDSYLYEERNMQKDLSVILEIVQQR